MSEITRIVRLSFDTKGVESFKAIFEESAPKIRTFPGCIEVRLMQDASNYDVYYTVSRWQSHNDLEAYRNSALFKSTWAKTKVLFREKAQAYSLKAI
jgi:heme-degrading monooxygenase HmoA